MPATKRFMNWTSVSYNNTTATGVTNVSIAFNSNTVGFSGDNDRYMTTYVNDMNDPTVTVTTADAAWANAIGPGLRATFTATHRDAKGAANSSIVYTLANAISHAPDVAGAHRAYGSSTIIFKAESSDGATSPLTYGVA